MKAWMLTLVSVVVGFGDIDTHFVPEPDDPVIAYARQPTTEIGRASCRERV